MFRDEQFWGRAVQRAPHGPKRDLGRSFHFGGGCVSLARQRISDTRRNERLLVNQNGNSVFVQESLIDNFAVSQTHAHPAVPEHYQ